MHCLNAYKIRDKMMLRRMIRLRIKNCLMRVLMSQFRDVFTNPFPISFCVSVTTKRIEMN